MTLSSARKTSCSPSSCRRVSKVLYRALSFEMPMTRVIRDERAVGKEACAMVSLNGRWGSAVMMHMVEVAASLRECGRWILPGFNRFLSTMCFFVVRTSHTGSLLKDFASSELSSSAASRFLVPESVSFRFASDLMCFRRAVDAFSVLHYRISGIPYSRLDPSTLT